MKAKLFVWLSLVIAGLGGGLAQGQQERQRWLDEPDLDKKDLLRWEYNHDQEALALVGLKAGMSVGEVGAGNGYFTLRLAQAVGPGGKVYANDIVDEGSLSVLRERAKQKGLTNIVTVLGTETVAKLPRQSLDVVFFVFALHDCAQPVQLMRDLKSSLKPNGKVVVIDSESPRLTREHWLSLFADSHYTVEKIVDQRPLIYQDNRKGVIFVLSAPL